MENTFTLNLIASRPFSVLAISLSRTRYKTRLCLHAYTVTEIHVLRRFIWNKWNKTTHLQTRNYRLIYQFYYFTPSVEQSSWEMYESCVQTSVQHVNKPMKIFVSDSNSFKQSSHWHVAQGCSSA